MHQTTNEKKKVYDDMCIRLNTTHTGTERTQVGIAKTTQHSMLTCDKK